MSEQRLVEWVRDASLEEKCDVLMQLTAMATADEPVGNDPSELWVSDEGKVRCAASGGGENLAWQAPEVIDVDSLSTAGATVGPAQRLYTVGLLGYWLFTGKDYYAEHDIYASMLPAYVSRRTYVIRNEDVGAVPCGNALVKWTFVDPNRRAAGTGALFEYLAANVPGTAQLAYVVKEGRRTTTVHTETRPVREPVRIAKDENIQTSEGTYRVSADMTIPYRPGTHAYKVLVTKVQSEPVGKVLFIPKSFLTFRNRDTRELVSFLDMRGGSTVASITLKMSYPDLVFTIMQQNADGSRTNLGSRAVPKPAGYGGAEYVLTLLFDSELHMLYARFADTEGRLLDARNLGTI